MARLSPRQVGEPIQVGDYAIWLFNAKPDHVNRYMWWVGTVTPEMRSDGLPFHFTSAFRHHTAGFAQTRWGARFDARREIKRLVKEDKKNGRHRSTEADHRDSPSGGAAEGTAFTRTAEAAYRAGAAISPGVAAAGLGWHSIRMANPPGPHAHAYVNRYGQTIQMIEDGLTPKPTLPVEKSDMPIMACRYARLVHEKGRLAFRSVTGKNRYFGVDADAVCATTWSRKCVDAPGVNCHCGFYAVPADLLPKHAHYGSNLVKLMVELSGRVIEHEEGYRAQHQRVLEAHLARCSLCDEPTERLLLHPEKGIRWQDCGKHEHAFTNVVVVTPAELSNMLGVPFGSM